MGHERSLSMVFVVITMATGIQATKEHCCKDECCEPPPLVPKFVDFRFDDLTKLWSIEPPPWLKTDSKISQMLSDGLEKYKALYDSWHMLGSGSCKCKTGTTTSSMAPTISKSGSSIGSVETTDRELTSTRMTSKNSIPATGATTRFGETIVTMKSSNGTTTVKVMESRSRPTQDDKLQWILIAIGSVVFLLLLTISIFCFVRRRMHNKNVTIKDPDNGQHPNTVSPTSVGYTNASFEGDTLTKGSSLNGHIYANTTKLPPKRTLSTEPLIPDSPCESVTYEIPFATIVEDQPNKDFNPDSPWQAEQHPIKTYKKRNPTRTLSNEPLVGSEVTMSRTDPYNLSSDGSDTNSLPRETIKEEEIDIVFNNDPRHGRHEVKVQGDVIEVKVQGRNEDQENAVKQLTLPRNRAPINPGIQSSPRFLYRQLSESDSPVSPTNIPPVLHKYPVDSSDKTEPPFAQNTSTEQQNNEHTVTLPDSVDNKRDISDVQSHIVETVSTVQDSEPQLTITDSNNWLNKSPNNAVVNNNNAANKPTIFHNRFKSADSVDSTGSMII